MSSLLPPAASSRPDRMSQAVSKSVLVAFSPALAERVLEVGAFLERFGFQVSTAASAAECLGACGRSAFGSVVFDLALAEELGLEVWLEKLKLISPLTAPLALGAYEQIDTLRRVSLQAEGDYVLFPLHLAELRSRLRRLVELRAAPPAEAEREAEDTRGLEDLVGRSAAMQEIRDRIRKVAALSSTVLVTGESGVGKELIARAVHRASPRRDRPFIALNCSALPETLLESELFGHEKGAFTGAQGLVRGKFELAHTGTLFLDEIGDMNPYTQAKILRALEEREFMRVGGSRTLRVDVRVVAATNADLTRRMAEGRFREDLYYRLKVITIEVPPLRERTGDVPELVRSFIDRFCRANGLAPRRVTDDALRVLERHRWPGNIRELRNALENVIALAPGSVIDVEDLPEAIRGAEARPWAPRPERPREAARAAAAEAGGVSSMDDMERELIRSALAEVAGNRTRAARLLKIGVRTLQRKIKKYGLDAVGAHAGAAGGAGEP